MLRSARDRSSRHSRPVDQWTADIGKPLTERASVPERKGGAHRETTLTCGSSSEPVLCKKCREREKEEGEGAATRGERQVSLILGTKSAQITQLGPHTQRWMRS